MNGNNSIAQVGNGTSTTLLTPPALDAASQQLLREAGETIPAAAPRVPIIWWSHNPAGWCVNLDEPIIVDKEKSDWHQITLRDRYVWFAEEIIVVVMHVSAFWFTFDAEGRRMRQKTYTEGARKAVQYACLVAGIEPKETHFALVSTTRVTKSKLLLEDVRKKQAEINAALGTPAPLWSIWLRLGARKDGEGRVIYETTRQGATIAPPRVLAAGWTRTSNWMAYKAIQEDVAAWLARTGDDGAVVTGEVVDEGNAHPF